VSRAFFLYVIFVCMTVGAVYKAVPELFPDPVEADKTRSLLLYTLVAGTITYMFDRLQANRIEKYKEKLNGRSK